MEAECAPVRPIDEFLRNLGLRLRLEWLASCAAGLASSGSGFESSDVAGKAKMCFEQFLLSDMNCSGAGVLPAGLHAMHKAELEGPFVLQVDEVINISSPLRERFRDAPAGFKRCLKLSLTDGVQRVFGIEYRPIRELEVLVPAGFKIVIRNVQIRRGLLMLVPEVLEVLGGLVESLDAARQRLVDEVNKPPRGKRKQGLFPLSERASLAAWPSNTINGGVQTNVSMPQGVNYPPSTSQAATMDTTIGETVVEEDVDHHLGRSTTEDQYVRRNERSTDEGLPGTHIRGSIVDEPASANGRANTVPNTAFGTTSDDHIGRFIGRNIDEEFSATNIQGSILDKPTSADNRLVMEPNTVVGTTSDVDDTCESVLEDAACEVEHPLILRGEKEPFTYLACLLAKWTTQMDITPYIQGKIKCFLTSVKGFQFKQRSTFELHVYVDDGSLISEVLIDHRVVQKGIGYSPDEVTAALSSSDKKIAADMRESMKRFQLFLAKFEGTMLVEINKKSSLPVALEMNQGCSTSDAWMLLRRLKKFTTPQKPQHSQLKPLNISP